MKISRLALVVALIVAAAGVYLIVEEGTNGSSNLPTSGWEPSDSRDATRLVDSEGWIDAYHSNVPALPGGDKHRVPAGYDVSGVVELPQEPGEPEQVGGIEDVVPTGSDTSTGVPGVTLPLVVEIVCAYDWDCGTAVRIADCETGGTFDPYAVGAEDERGWYQIRFNHWDKPQCNPDYLFDPAYNTACAYSIWVESGWSPWSCY